jgi:hypothetical protein
MHRDRDELLAFARYGMLPRPPDGPRPPRRRRNPNRNWSWRWRRRPSVVPPRPVAPDPVPAQPAPLDIHEYLELEFTVGQEGRR